MIWIYRWHNLDDDLASMSKEQLIDEVKNSGLESEHTEIVQDTIYPDITPHYGYYFPKKQNILWLSRNDHSLCKDVSASAIASR